MKKIWIIALLLAAAGCNKGPAQNAATDYGKSLSTDVSQAKDAAEKANKAIAVDQNTASQAQGM
jgi:hypothetical protein